MGWWSMKVYYLSDFAKKRNSQKRKIPDYIKIKDYFTEIAIEGIKQGESPWWLTNEDKIKFKYLLKDKPWLLKAGVN